ncbi:MAG: hypothetical protein Tsb0010_13580 [Parvularculaceae bacterium]
MKSSVLAAILSAFLSITGASGTLSSAALAQGQEADRLLTAAFAIENMTCATCPITVRTAMKRVKGVKSVAVDYDAKTATVTFDPEITAPDQIAAASTNAGYPASPLEIETEI